MLSCFVFFRTLTLRWTRAVCSITNVRVSSDGRSLQLLTESGNSADYDVMWLRHNCQCCTCRSTSGQKTVSGKDLRRDLTIGNASLNDSQLLVNWNRNDIPIHSGHFDTSWLINSRYDKKTLENDIQQSAPNHSATALPTLQYKDVMESHEGLWSWLHYLNYTGICLISDVPTAEENTMKVAHRISHIQTTLYGELFDVTIEKNLTNIAYSEVGLEMHMDLLYYQSPPGLQILHCLRNDPCVEGGESTLLDGYAVVSKLRERYPKQFQTLTKVQVPFQKIHYERDKPVCMTYRRPHIDLDRSGQVTGINWAPAHQGTLTIYEEELEDYYDAYILLYELFNESPSIIEHRLLPGQLLSFNNRRILHGRRSFKLNGGDRHLKGLYINIDESISKLSVLSKQMKKTAVVKHMLNESWYI